METPQLKKLVEFCILMEGNNGIMGKAPSYIMKKWEIAHGTGDILDTFNLEKFEEYLKFWRIQNDQIN